VAGRLAGFKTRLLYFARHRADESTEAQLGVQYTPLNDLLAGASIVSLHVPSRPGVSVPTLVVVGADDAALEVAQRAAQMIPAASLVILPGEDHSSALHAQSYKDAVCGFLNRAGSLRWHGIS
jgi:pimeloyl-ACP methyl ester carboxylesterase